LNVAPLRLREPLEKRSLPRRVVEWSRRRGSRSPALRLLGGNRRANARAWHVGVQRLRARLAEEDVPVLVPPQCWQVRLAPRVAARVRPVTRPAEHVSVDDRTVRDEALEHGGGHVGGEAHLPGLGQHSLVPLVVEVEEARPLGRTRISRLSSRHRCTIKLSRAAVKHKKRSCARFLVQTQLPRTFRSVATNFHVSVNNYCPSFFVCTFNVKSLASRTYEGVVEAKLLRPRRPRENVDPRLSRRFPRFLPPTLIHCVPIYQRDTFITTFRNICTSTCS